ncbi:MAG TPA: cytochrome c oxidase subunit II [Gemmatimonadaceae bacterium]|nr:cytochrome c oxidase subunit II [Gemmatimonadaceae bacterium]
MPFQLRPRWLATRGAGAAALTVALLALSACSADYPNSVFHSRTEFNRDTDALFQLIINLGVVVFVLVFVLLLVTMWRYRSRPGQRAPEHVHGNTTLEILWTVIPALILVWIAIPTVRTIFRTQAPAPAGALQIEVIGHQWWWEFRYPEYGIVTANELYLPKGRTVNFALKTQDVIHSFWVPALGGKRDLIANRTNHLWMTPDSTTEKAFNGACVEYCGASHANMRFRAFVVDPAEFDSWAAHERSAAVFQLAGAAPAPAVPPPAAGGTERAGPTVASTGPGTPVGGAGGAVSQAGYYFPAAELPKHVAAYAPIPDGLTIDDAVLAAGDAQRGGALMTSGMGGCVGCHTISGAKNMVGILGPNLTHIGSRLTLGAGLFPNDAKHLALWIKNARLMKPGITMPTIGKGQIDPQTKKPSQMGMLTDQQIADMVAYLRALK